MTTPFQAHERLGHHPTRHSPNGIQIIEECDDCPARFLHDPCIGYPIALQPTARDDSCDFQEPGGRSALRLATKTNPRIYPCPTCERPNRLTPTDVRLGYQCDACADRDEMGF